MCVCVCVSDCVCIQFSGWVKLPTFKFTCFSSHLSTLQLYVLLPFGVEHVYTFEWLARTICIRCIKRYFWQENHQKYGHIRCIRRYIRFWPTLHICMGALLPYGRVLIAHTHTERHTRTYTHTHTHTHTHVNTHTRT